MKISIKAKPNSKKEYVKIVDNTHYVVSVHAVAEKGKANTSIIKSLSEYFGIPVSKIFIISGITSRNKIVELPLTYDMIENKEPQKKLF